MKLTKAQVDGLSRIAAFMDKTGKPFHKETASKTNMAVRSNVLDALRSAGAIKSASPFSFSYYSVEITDAGRSALNAKGE